MSDLVGKLMEQAMSLPDADRADLAYSLLETLPESLGALESDSAFDTKLSRRSEELKEGAVQGISASKLMVELREKYS